MSGRSGWARGRCPTCGSVRVVAVREDVVVPLRGARRVVRALEQMKCLDCGERIFGLHASRRLDAALLKRRGKAP